MSSNPFVLKELISTNPALNDNILGKINISTKDEVKDKYNQARQSQKMWQDLGLEKRIAILRNLNELFQKNRDEFVKHQSTEMGMPNELSQGIVDAAINDLNWNCDNAVKYLSPEISYEDEKQISEIIYEPYGVMGCIVAWNFPLANFVTSTSQALLAGNTVLMKYSEEVPLFCKYLENIIFESDIPEGVVNFVYGDGDIGRLMMEYDIDFLSFTGSSETGHKLYQKAAEKFIPVALELGGSSPGIIFEECDITDGLIETIFWKRFLNSAQFCDGLKRLIVHQSHFETVIEKLSAYASTIKLGNPLDTETQLGPLVAERQVKKLEKQVQDAIDKGARCHCGGKRPDGLNGAFYQPTILSNITKDMKVWKEEVFGPVLPVISFETYDEAIELANDTQYGLSGSIYSNDKALTQRAMRDIKAGSIDSNTAHYFQSQNPFGGYKQSGIGRQQGRFGFHEVCQTKIMAYEK